MAAFLPPGTLDVNTQMEGQKSQYFFLFPQSHRSSFLIMFWTASAPNIRLYASICSSERGQNTTWSYFLGSLSLMMSLVLHTPSLALPRSSCRLSARRRWNSRLYLRKKYKGSSLSRMTPAVALALSRSSSLHPRA